MKVTEKKLADGVIRLDCEATAQEVNNALREAGEAFAMQMGVRPQPGKTVNEVVQEALGIADLDKVVEANAIEVLVPRALDRRNLVPAFPPKASPSQPFERGKRFAFTLDVSVKPEYELTSYDPVEVTVQPFVFDESVIQKQLDEMARRYTAYVTADPKPLENGDACEIAMDISRDGEEIKALCTEGRTYILGQGLMPPGFDEALLGMEPGQTKEFSFDAPQLNESGEPVEQKMDCKVTVKEVQKEAVPVIDDAWVKANLPGMGSKADLVGDMRRVFEQQQREGYQNYVSQMVLSKLSGRFQGRIADEIYEATRTQLVQNLRMELQQQGMQWEQFVAANGGEQQFGMMLMMQTREILVNGFSLDAVYRHERMSLTDADLDAACVAMNPQGNPRMMREQLEAAGRGFALREAAERQKALAWVVDHAKITEQAVEPAPAPAPDKTAEEPAPAPADDKPAEEKAE